MTSDERVECHEACEQLVALGCTFAQGYLLSRPLPGEELARWLAARGGGTACDANAPASLSAPAPASRAHLGVAGVVADHGRERGSGAGHVT